MLTAEGPPQVGPLAQLLIGGVGCVVMAIGARFYWEARASEKGRIGRGIAGWQMLGYGFWAVLLLLTFLDGAWRLLRRQ